MTKEAKRARAEAGKLPLFYTEWSISSNCTAAIHDTTAAAASFVKTVLDNQNIIDGSSYWTFSRGIRSADGGRYQKACLLGV